MVNPWEAIYRGGHRIFIQPHPDVVLLCHHILPGAPVLDLGCGAGRHLVYLAKQGFPTYGMDSSPSALQLAQEWLKEEGLEAQLSQCDMLLLPYPDSFFNAVVGVQVIHHNRLADIKKTIQEIERVLVPQGLLLLTVPVSKNESSSQFIEIEPGTYLPLNGPEKGLLHHYFTVAELKEVLANFDIEDIHIDEVNHYVLKARLRARGGQTTIAVSSLT